MKSKNQALRRRMETPASSEKKGGMNRRNALGVLAAGLTGAVATRATSSLAAGEERDYRDKRCKPVPGLAPADIGVTSKNEHERRLSALRGQMDKHGFSVWVICGKSTNYQRGRIVYVTDIFTLDDALVVLPKSGEPIFVSSGGDAVHHAKTEWVTDFGVAADPAKTRWVTDFRYSRSPGEEVGKILRELKIEGTSIGLVGLDDGSLSAVHLKQLQQELPTVTLKDATRLFDDLLQVKSEEELIKMRNTSEIARRVFKEVEAGLYPGIHKREVEGLVAKFTKIYGCYNPGIDVWLNGSTECLQPRDVMSVFFESPGPSRYWAEVSHSYSFGAPPKDVQQQWGLWNEAYSKAVQAAKPGAMQRDIVDAFTSIMTPQGYELATDEDGQAWIMHQIGLDAVEDKWWYPGYDIELKEGEVFALHPSVVFHNAKEARRFGSVYMCDSILVTSRGGERLTFPDDKITQLKG